MGRALDAFKQFFTEDEWPFDEVEEHAMLTTGFKGKNGNFRCYVRERSEQEQIAFYSVSPMDVPGEHRTAVAEFVARANYGMVIGNFEFDFSDGEIRYKTSADVEGTEVNQTFVKNLVYANLVMMDQYLPGLMQVVYAGVTPLDAIRTIEQAN
ncbi:MAG: YbjN domain-containing protein [Deltaproteobacteria bacterium]|nr:YbjN domain-containing protein [Deltaproteobacteria bacterium]